jgi:hypothetical protein
MERNTGKQKATGRCPTSSKAAQVSSKGISSMSDFNELCSAMLDDVLKQKISVGMANANSRILSNMLRGVEVQFKYGNLAKKITSIKNLKV